METQSKEDNLINIKEFLENFLLMVPAETVCIKNKNVDECIKSEMKLNDTDYDKLKEECNLDLLNPNNKIKTSKDIADLGDTNMISVKYLCENFQLTNKHSQTLEIKLLKELKKLNEESVEDENMVVLPDAVITLQISQSLTLKSKTKKFSWSEEYYVLGNNYLSDLKDKISCFRNEIRVGEFSENPNTFEASYLLKDYIPTGFFFIEDVFYSDCRNNANDCSTELIEWAKENGYTMLSSKKMEETKFLDLNIKLGYPYLYNHLGNCEHLIIFQNIKIFNPAIDCFDKSKYPLLKNRNRGRLLHCWLCTVIYAKWIVKNSEFVVDDPCLLCERCLKNTHYDENEKKLGNFELYHLSQFL